MAAPTSGSQNLPLISSLKTPSPNAAVLGLGLRHTDYWGTQDSVRSSGQSERERDAGTAERQRAAAFQSCLQAGPAGLLKSYICVLSE